MLLSFTLLGEAVVSLHIYMSQRSCSWELQRAEGGCFLKLGKYSSPCSSTEVLQTKSAFFFVFDAGILQFSVCVCLYNFRGHSNTFPLKPYKVFRDLIIILRLDLNINVLFFQQECRVRIKIESALNNITDS